MKENDIICKLLSTEYINDSHKLTFKCKCGSVFERRWADVRRSKSGTCVKCSQKYVGECNKISYTRIEKILEQKGFTMLGEYQGVDKKLLCVDSQGYRYNLYLKVIMNGGNTWMTSPQNPYSIDNVKKFIENNNLNCKLISDKYINCKIKLKFRCCCGSIFYKSFDMFKQNKVDCCDYCNKIKISNIEQSAKDYLDDTGVDYVCQYPVKINSPQYASKFDFKVLFGLDTFGFIEVDGIQHFEFNKFWHKNSEGFQIQKNRDLKKDIYCKDNNIPLLRIKYDEFDDLSYKQKIKNFINKQSYKK